MRHSLQLLLPALGVVCPSGQGLQCGLNLPPLKVPLGHGVQVSVWGSHSRPDQHSKFKKAIIQVSDTRFQAAWITPVEYIGCDNVTGINVTNFFASVVTKALHFLRSIYIVYSFYNNKKPTIMGSRCISERAFVFKSGN